MPRLTLGLALHNHQPVGNFHSVFAQAYDAAYEPMVGALERHPAVRVALHYSGPLLDWLLREHPDLIERIRALVARGQAEIMTGGYYEPILPIIPDRDKHGQILKMTGAVRDLFGYEATGLWLAERVWEPHLPKALAAAGITYTIVDDTHFQHVGLSSDELAGYFITEEGGAPLRIFPSAKALRYRIPWATVETLMAWLRGQAADDDRILVMGDDGEKFGLWPGTRALCWERGWIEAFFSALEGARPWLAVVPPGEWIRQHPPQGRIYLPTASYDEMTEWALPPEGAARLPVLRHDLEAEGRTDLLPFLRGGYWRHFLVKYPEINTLHKTMLRVSRKAWRMRPGQRRDAALDHLWQAQCNCPYWHGVFGGIYLGHIRSANYSHLIAAERLADRGRKPRRWVEARIEDLDGDGWDEVLLRSDAQVLTVDPGEGGSVVAWDVREAGVNLVNVMTRRVEGYHGMLRRALARGEAVLATTDDVETIHTSRVRVKEWGLDRHLTTDWYRRSSFLDHFLEPGGTPAAFARGGVRELGDFVNQPFEAEIRHLSESEAGGPGARALAVRLVRDGHVWVGGVHASVRVEKTLLVRSGIAGLEAAYRVTNQSGAVLAAELAIETNWGTTGPDAVVVASGSARRVGDAGRSEGVKAFALHDPGRDMVVGVRVEAPEPQALWVVPIEVVSASEAGFERTFQGASLLVVWPMRLEPGEVWGGTLSFEVQSPA
jgi:alpha-amylase